MVDESKLYCPRGPHLSGEIVFKRFAHLIGVCVVIEQVLSRFFVVEREMQMT